MRKTIIAAAAMTAAFASTITDAHDPSTLSFTGDEDCNYYYEIAVVSYMMRQVNDHINDALEELQAESQNDNDDLIREITFLAYEQQIPAPISGKKLSVIDIIDDSRNLTLGNNFAKPIMVACLRKQ